MEARPGVLGFLMQPMHASSKKSLQRELEAKRIPQNFKGPPPGFRLASPPMPTKPLLQQPPPLVTEAPETALTEAAHHHEPDAVLNASDASSSDLESSPPSRSSSIHSSDCSEGNCTSSKSRGMILPGRVALAPEHFRPIRSQPTESERAEWRNSSEKHLEKHQRDIDAEMIMLRETVKMLQFRVDALEVNHPSPLPLSPPPPPRQQRPTTPPPIWSVPAPPADVAQQQIPPSRTRKKKRRSKKHNESPQGLRRPRPASDLGVRRSSPSPAGERRPRARPSSGEL